jgi:Helix-turn-helix domain
MIQLKPGSPPSSLNGPNSASALPLKGALKTTAAAEYLALTPLTLRKLMKRGLLKPNRATRHLLFPISELDRFLRDGQA